MRRCVVPLLALVALVAPGACSSSGGAAAPVTTHDSSAFCTTMRTLQTITAGVTDAEGTKEGLRKLTAIYQQLAKTAPPELATDMQLVAANAQRQYDILARNDFDLDKVPNDPDFAKLTADVRTDAAVKAGNHLTTYAKEACGVDVNAFDAPTTTTG